MNAGLPSIRCPLTKAADDAISLFGDENAESVVPLRDGRFKTTGTAIGSCRPFATSAALASRRGGRHRKAQDVLCDFYGAGGRVRAELVHLN